MLIQNTVITYSFILEANASFASHVETYFDLQITAPDGVVTFLEGSGAWATTFLQPTATVDGLITYAFTPTQLGVYTFLVCTGAAASFTILDQIISLIVEQDSDVSSTVNLA